MYQVERLLLGIWNCPECDQDKFSIIHYLINYSNDTDMTRTNLKQLIQPEEHGYKAIDQAAIIIYR